MAYRSVLIRWRAKDVVADTAGDPDVAPDAVALPQGTRVTIAPAPSEIADLTSQPPVTYYPQKITAMFDAEGDLVGPVDVGGTPINPGVKGVAIIDPSDENLQPHDWTISVRVDFGGGRSPITYSARLATGEDPDPADAGNPDQLRVYYLTRNSPVPQYTGRATDAAEWAAQAAGSAADARQAADDASSATGIPTGGTAGDVLTRAGTGAAWTALDADSIGAVAIARRLIHLADRGVSHLASAAANRAAIQQALNDAQADGSGVVFPWVPPGQWIDIDDVLTIQSGGITVEGVQKSSRIRQTSLPKPVFEVSGPDVTIRDVHLAGAVFDYTGQTASFRGETIQVYASGVWVSASRVDVARVTVENMICAVHHSNWDTITNAEGPALTDCSVSDLLVVGCNFGIVPRGVNGFTFHNIRGAYQTVTGCSLAPHLIYFTTGAVINQDVAGSDCYARSGQTSYAYQIKNCANGTFTGLVADGCAGLLNIMSSTDLRISNVQSINDTAVQTIEGNISIQGTNTRIKIDGVTIQQAAGGGMAIWTDGTDTDTEIRNAQVVANHTAAGPAEVYDVSMRGTNPLLENVSVVNVGTATFDAAIGVWGGTGCSIRNVAASGEARAVRIRSGSGHSLIYDPAKTTGGVRAIDDLTGAAIFAPLAIGGAWTAYNPALSGGASIGNGTAVGWWTQIGKTVHFRLRVTRGSTTAWGTTGVFISLPVPAKGDTDPLLQGKLFRTGVNSFFLWCAPVVSGGSAASVVPYTFGTSGVGAKITDTAPAAAVAGDYIDLRGTYEAA